MKRALLFVLSAVTLGAARIPESRLASLPLGFEPTPASGRYLAHAGGLTIEVAAADAAIGGHNLRFIGASSKARATLENLLPGRSHYFLGNDAHQWRTQVPQYARLRFHSVYPGIDLVYYGTRGELEFDFIVAPAADPRRILLEFDGELKQPRIYQGERAIGGGYRRSGARIRFSVGDYDRTRALVIDPVISFATLVGGGGSDVNPTIAVDSTGAVYIAGTTTSGTFPAINALQSRLRGQDAFVSKLDPTGSTLVYSTFLGGSGAESGFGIAVDRAGSAYVAGFTNSQDFPAVNAAQAVLGGSNDGFAAKLSPDGSALIYSTYLGGSNTEQAGAVAVDVSGNAYIAGFTLSTNFPTWAAWQGVSGGGQDGFVVKLGPGGDLIFSTYFGGSGSDVPFAIAADTAGNVFVTGSTSSTNFPLKNALQNTLGGVGDAFVFKLAADGSGPVYSTYLGGASNDNALGIAVDAAGNAYVAGTTASTDFPTANALQRSLTGDALFKSTDAAASFAPSDRGLGGTPSLVVVDPVQTSNLYALASGSLYKSTDAGGTWKAVPPESGLPAGLDVVALDPTTPSTIYAGGSKGAIFKSTDAGASWTAANFGGAFTLTLAVDPKNPSLIWVGSGGGQTLDGLYKSTDAGATWNATSIKGVNKAVKAFAIDPSNPSTLYANAGNRLQKSTDGGDTWNPVPAATFFVGLLLIDPQNSAVLYAHDFNSVFKSSDGGATWRDTAPGAQTRGLVMDPKNTSTLYASTNNGIYKTTDGGDSWQRANPGPSTGLGTLAIDPVNPSTLYVASVVFSDAFVAKLNPDGSALMYSTYLGGTGSDGANAIAVDASGNAYIGGFTASVDFPLQNAIRSDKLPISEGFLARLSADGSALALSSFLGSEPVARGGLAVGADGAIYLAGTSSRTDFPTSSPLQDYRTRAMFRSDNGGASWSGAALSGSVRVLAVDPRNSSRVFAAASGVFRSLDGGQTWTRLSGLPFLTTSIAIDPATPTNIYAGDIFFGVSKSVDGGDTWRTVRVSATNSLASMISALAVDPRNATTLYAGTTAGVWKSADAGETWTRTASPGFAAPSIAIDSQSTLYAVTLPTSSGGVPGLAKSLDGGDTWTPIAGSIPALVLYLDPSSSSTLYLAGAGGLFKSTDGGAQFTNIYSGGSVSALAIDSTTPSILYIGSSAQSLLKSTDGGATWQATGLTIPAVLAIAVDPGNSARVYAGASTNPSDVFVMKIVP